MTQVLSGELNIAVYYEDTDFSGFVYHANYLKFFERAREELFGREHLRNMFLQGRHFVAKDAHLDFHRPARHGDMIRVHTRIDFDHAVFVKCHHTAYRLEGGEKLVTGLLHLVTVNERGFPIRVPQEFLPSSLNPNEG